MDNYGVHKYNRGLQLQDLSTYRGFGGLDAHRSKRNRDRNAILKSDMYKKCWLVAFCRFWNFLIAVLCWPMSIKSASGGKWSDLEISCRNSDCNMRLRRCAWASTKIQRIAKICTCDKLTPFEDKQHKTPPLCLLSVDIQHKADPLEDAIIAWNVMVSRTCALMDLKLALL